MIRIKKEKPLSFLISVEEETLDVVMGEPIKIDGVEVTEMSIDLSYYWDWVVRRGLNVRVENTYDEISETTTHSVRKVDKQGYLGLTPYEHSTHIKRFIKEYKNQSI